MAIGDVFDATAGDSVDLSYVDVGLYDSAGYGSVYILDAERPAVVDTGTGYRYEAILEGLRTVGIDPADLAAICLTHVHLDHAGGASVLARECPEASVYVHESGAKFLEEPTPIWEGTKGVVGDRIDYYREPDPIPTERIVELEAGDTVDLGDHALDVHRAPGHAFHQVVYHDRTCHGVFTGDAAGIYVPQTDSVRQTSPPPGFDLEGCLDDVAMLQDLDPSALYYGHFGDAPTGDRLSAYAETLESWVEAVAEKRETMDDEALVEHFASRAADESVWRPAHARAEEEMNVAGVLHYLDERESE